MRTQFGQGLVRIPGFFLVGSRLGLSFGLRWGCQRICFRGEQSGHIHSFGFACTGCSCRILLQQRQSFGTALITPLELTPLCILIASQGCLTVPCGCHSFVMRIWAGCCLSEEKRRCFLEVQHVLHGIGVCCSVVNVTEAEGPHSTAREPSEVASPAHSPAKPHKHCWLEVPGCVGTTAGGYLVTKGKTPSQGGVTGCLVSDFRDVRTHTTAVWVKLNACHIPVVLILLFMEIKIVFLHGARTYFIEDSLLSMEEIKPGCKCTDASLCAGLRGEPD